MCEDQSGEFVCGCWGLKGYNLQVRRKNNELSPGISSTWMKMFMNLFCIICLIFFTGGNKKETGNSETETRTTQ